MFATGIENSDPTIEGGRVRRDQLEECGFHGRWREDFALVRETGCGFLRYGPSLHRTLLGPGRHDWAFADETFAELHRLRIVPVVDLCHFGVPDWIGDFQNPDFPALFAGYARAFAERFLTLDLNYGRRIESEMYDYLLDNGMTREEYRFFIDASELKRHCIMGNDYYWTNEHLVQEDGLTRASGEVFGYAVLTHQYHARYRLPVMHTATSLREGPKGDEGEYWLWKQWANVLRVRNDGVPVVGFTWYSLTDQVDWGSALREERGEVDPVGLYDLDRRIRPVGRAYKRLVQQWRDVLPAQSLCLQVPVVMPSAHNVEQLPDAYWALQASRRANGDRPRDAG